MTTTISLTDFVVRIDIDDYWNQSTYAEADTYFQARGTSAWVGLDAVKSQALQRAWDYMGTLNWIEDIFVDYVEQPDDIKNAHILLALEELIDPGILTPSLTQENYISKKGIGSGVITKEYRSDAPVFKRFRGVDMLLAPYILSSANIRIERG